MRKLFLFLILVVTIFGCQCKRHEFTETSHGIIPDQYIVIMKESFDAPVIKTRRNDPNRKKQKNDNKGERDRKQNKLKKFLRDNGLEGRDKQIFVDIAVGAVINMDSTKARAILNDTANVEDVIPDVSVQINPIQQTDPDVNINPIQQWLSPIVPTNEINPIQQNDSIQNRYDIDTVRHQTKALVTAGGPTDGSTKTSAIWFLDTGIDPSSYLNVDPSLGVTFFVGTNAEDDNGHGTFCAGIAAGRPVRGGAGLDEIHYGLSEGAIVVSVKVLDLNGSGSWGNIIAGLNWVAQYSEPGDVVNISLGAYDASNFNCFFPGISRALDRVTSNGVFVALSAGNDAGNALCNRPGCINGTHIYTASSINADSTCAVYANFGRPPMRDPVDYVTVGTRVFSLWDDGQYRMASGTSASSALLAGIIHARNGDPASVSTVNCLGSNYRIGIR